MPKPSKSWKLREEVTCSIFLSSGSAIVSLLYTINNHRGSCNRTSSLLEVLAHLQEKLVYLVLHLSVQTYHSRDLLLSAAEHQDGLEFLDDQLEEDQGEVADAAVAVQKIDVDLLQPLLEAGVEERFGDLVDEEAGFGEGLNLYEVSQHIVLDHAPLALCELEQPVRIIFHSSLEFFEDGAGYSQEDRLSECLSVTLVDSMLALDFVPLLLDLV